MRGDEMGRADMKPARTGMERGVVSAFLGGVGLSQSLPLITFSSIRRDFGTT
jgi:hypothetical protein